MKTITCVFCGVQVLRDGGCKVLLEGLERKGICISCLREANARMAVILRQLRESGQESQEVLRLMGE